MTVWKPKFWLMYVASRERFVAELIEGVSGAFSFGLFGLGGSGSRGGSAAFSLTVTVSKVPPSRLSKNSLLPSLFTTMSHGRTDLGEHMSTLRILSVMYTVAASLAASCKGHRESVVKTNSSQGFHLLHNGIITRGDVVFNSVLRL